MNTSQRATALAATLLAISTVPVSAAPTIVGGFNHPGLIPDSAQCSRYGAGTVSAIGPNSLLQVVNCKAAIINRTTGAGLTWGPLSLLAGNNGAHDQPQIFWDPTTSRFYYAMATTFGPAGAQTGSISYGYSKTASPVNLTTDWCHYSYSIGAAEPNFVRAGDSWKNLIISYMRRPNGALIGPSNILAVTKPGVSSQPAACVAPVRTEKSNATSAAGDWLIAPTPANQIDDSNVGRVVALNPDNKSISVFDVTQPAIGAPIISNARTAPIAAYTSPPASVAQPGANSPRIFVSPYLSQAVQAFDPRLNRNAIWMAHTIRSRFGTNVRWYEIDPAPLTPVVLRTGDWTSGYTSLFNPAISPDRRADGPVRAFGSSFVLQANFSSAAFAPGIMAMSSVNGAAPSVTTIRNGVGPYKDATCKLATDTCIWGDASAAPDPRPLAAGKGVVWGSNEYSGVAVPSLVTLNHRTNNFAVTP